MAPKGMLLYTKDCDIPKHVRTIFEDVAKKAQNSWQNMWEAIYRSRVGYDTAMPSLPVIIEASKWPLPGPHELGPVNTSMPLMPKNARGRASTALTNATAASNVER